MPKRTFNLKFLFWLTLFVALLLGGIQLRPKPTITVRIGPDGVQVNKVPLVEKSELLSELTRRSQYIRLWQDDPQLRIEAAESTDMRDVLKILETGQEAGIDSISLLEDRPLPTN